jgi:uncharacterized membrane protein YdjX (TVP38/TMEM64 family)
MDKKLLKNIVKLAIGILMIGIVWWLISCQCVDIGKLTPASVRDYVQGFGPLAVPVYIIAYALNTISLVPPIAILSLTAGLAFGKVWGAVYLMIGAMLGTSATFYISRFFARSLIENMLKGKGKKLDEGLSKRGFITVLFFRIVPIVPYEVLNYACGLSKMRFRDYFLATFLGLIPGVIISAFFGGSLGEIRDFRDILSGKFLIAVLLMLILMLIPAVYLYLKKKREQNART